MKDKKGRFKKGYASEYGSSGGKKSWLSRIKGKSKAEIREMMSSVVKARKRDKNLSTV